MKPEQVTQQIQQGSRKAHKDYAFDETHDAERPADFWFQQAHTGLVLFAVFYTQACRWSRCLGCNLPARMSQKHVPFSAIMRQIDCLFQHPEITRRAARIHKVIVSNNGSVLDEATFSSTALMYLLAKLNLHLPALEVLSLETRPEYADFAELEFLSRALTEGDSPTRLELAIGFEAFNDHIRNALFDKGLPLNQFEKLVRRIAPHGYLLKTYFMQKPVPEMTDEQAVLDIQQAIDYLSDIAAKHQVQINLHLNPTYAAKGTQLETAFHQGRFKPPLLKDVARAALHGHGKPLSIYIGLSDEGLAIANGSFLRKGEEPMIQALEQFNQSQDYHLLERLLADESTATEADQPSRHLGLAHLKSEKRI
ncbi:MAG: hypothetical protein HKP58_09545 [Desulfatitalea sp.]|nr:hypothetical protein [Desulfatitalea sp.]NNK00646.1 hypothetical protein [Desulfatitalea sp.]